MKIVPTSLGCPRPDPMLADRIRSMLGALLVLIGFLALVQAASGAEPPPSSSQLDVSIVPRPHPAVGAGLDTSPAGRGRTATDVRDSRWWSWHCISSADRAH